MRGYLLGILLLLKHCICNDVHDFNEDINDFKISNDKLFVLTGRHLQQMRHDLVLEERKEVPNTNPNRVNILVPFDYNDTLITCGTFNNGYCEILDINDITKSIYYESVKSIGLPQNEKSVAFIVNTGSSSYLLVGKNNNIARPQDFPYPVATLWNTLQTQAGGIFSNNEEGLTPSIQTTAREVEFVDGFQEDSSLDLYLFLNTKTDSERKVHVLWMDSFKRKKSEIFRSLQSAVIKCCSDKARPVLVSSAVVPSEKAVIWAGVFSAQDQQDPENTALALYDISRIQGRVKEFCAQGEQTCSSESGSELEPLSVVIKSSSMSSVAAVRSGSWIVLFMGTSDGQLIKLMLDENYRPGCPIVLYKSDDELAVFSRMHFDPVDFKHIYIALRKQIRRVPVVNCAKYRILKDCRSALDPLCGWCVKTLRCSTLDECSKSLWMSSPKDSFKELLVSFQLFAQKSSRKITLHLALSLESTGNPAFSCVFSSGSVNLCDESDLTAVFPKCSCTFSDQLLHSGELNVSALINIEDQKITEMLTLTNCLNITDNSPSPPVTQCVQCISSGCHWSSTTQRCDWSDGFGPQLHIRDACKDLLSKYEEPEILSLEPHKVSFHGRNNVLLRGRNLDSVTKIRIQGDLDCIAKESPVFDGSSDTLVFHIPPSETKGKVKMCVVTEDDRCHGNSIITYSSLPSCTEIQPKYTWYSGGRKIYVHGSNMELVESINFEYPLQAQYDPNTGNVWFLSPQFFSSYSLKRFSLKVGNSTLSCGQLSLDSPTFTAFTSFQVANDLQVNIKKKADELNLRISEVNVEVLHGDLKYHCIVERIESRSVICTIKGESGTVPGVDSLQITVGNYETSLRGQGPAYLVLFSIAFPFIFSLFILIFCILLFIFRN
ncbi:plexin-C1-like [Danio rerio]|uniref:Plexin-C1-like n=1 Tax=Danio rerio TaxID=7955 RepID=A0AC58J9R5_DANRE